MIYILTQLSLAMLEMGEQTCRTETETLWLSVKVEALNNWK